MYSHTDWNQKVGNLRLLIKVNLKKEVGPPQGRKPEVKKRNSTSSIVTVTAEAEGRTVEFQKMFLSTKNKGSSLRHDLISNKGPTIIRLFMGNGKIGQIKQKFKPVGHLISELKKTIDFFGALSEPSAKIVIRDSNSELISSFNLQTPLQLPGELKLHYEIISRLLIVCSYFKIDLKYPANFAREELTNLTRLCNVIAQKTYLSHPGVRQMYAPDMNFKKRVLNQANTEPLVFAEEKSGYSVKLMGYTFYFPTFRIQYLNCKFKEVSKGSPDERLEFSYDGVIFLIADNSTGYAVADLN